MSPSLSVAANLPPDMRQKLAIEVLAKSKPISHLATENKVSRKFLHLQGLKAKQALAECFEPTTPDHEVLFYLPVTKTWLTQLMLGLLLICHSSYRGVIELFRDLFDLPISIGTIHNRLESAAESAVVVNEAQDLSRIKVGLQDEIYQGPQPVLTGVDAASTYCYLLKGVEHRDQETWSWHLLEPMEQGFNPDYTIADGGTGLRAGQKAVMPKTPCHGDVFHLQHQGQSVVNRLNRLAMGAATRRQSLEQEMAEAKQKAQGNRVSKKLTQARQAESTAIALSGDVKTLIHWLTHDVLELAGPALVERQELYDFVVAELRLLEGIGGKQVRTLSKALQNQRDDILGFAQVLDDKLAEIAQRLDTPL